MESDMKITRLAAFVALALALPVSVLAQGRTQIDTTVRLDGQGMVDLSLISGQIRVTAWDRQEVKISASTSGTQRLRLDASASRVTLTIEHDRNRGRHNNSDARYDVTVPRNANLNLEAVSGDISAAGTQGEIDASSVSGEVEVSGGAREVNVESVSGSVWVSQVNGNLRAESVSGSVRADGVTGTVEASSVSGLISLVNIQSRDVRTETVSGGILYTGSIEPGGKYDFESHSGNLRLNVPRGTGAHVSVETFSGDVETDFPAVMPPAAGQRRRGSFEFTIGDGRARITAHTFSGRIMINNRDAVQPTRRDDE